MTLTEVPAPTTGYGVLRLATMPGDEWILRRECAPVETFDRELRKLGNEMISELRAHRGLGLAAPQVFRPCRLFVYELQPGSPKVVVNPRILDRSFARVPSVEGCLSLPGKHYQVNRHEWIQVRYLDPKGKRYERRLEGQLAVLFQHELDHLDGLLISDHGVPL